MIRSLFFEIQELVSPEHLELLTEEACWCLFEDLHMERLDMLRKLYGSALMINGSGRKYSGIRPKDCTEGAPGSMHKIMDPLIRAFDVHCSNLPLLEKIIRDSAKVLGIVRMEDPASTPEWRHIEITASALSIPDLKVFIP